MTECKAMIQVRPGLSVSRQYRLLGVARSSVYTRYHGIAATDLVLMRHIGACFRVLSDFERGKSEMVPETGVEPVRPFRSEGF